MLVVLAHAANTTAAAGIAAYADTGLMLQMRRVVVVMPVRCTVLMVYVMWVVLLAMMQQQSAGGRRSGGDRCQHGRFVDLQHVHGCVMVYAWQTNACLVCLCVPTALVDELQLRATVQYRLQQRPGGQLLPPQQRASTDGETLLPLQLRLLLRILVAQHRVENAGQIAGQRYGGHGRRANCGVGV